MESASTQLMCEIADLMAGWPDRQALLDFHPSDVVQKRVRQLLDLSRDGLLTAEQRSDLDECETIEVLMRLAKAKARVGNPR